MTAVNSQRRRRWRRRWARLQCRHRALPACLPGPCLRVLHISALCALCSALLVALNYAEFNQLTLIGAPQSGECQVELTQSHQSCAGAGELCGQAINQTSTTSTAQPMTTNHRRSDAPSSRKSLRCSLWAIRSVATRFAWMHSLLACGLAGKLIEIWLFFSLLFALKTISLNSCIAKEAK